MGLVGLLLVAIIAFASANTGPSASDNGSLQPPQLSQVSMTIRVQLSRTFSPYSGDAKHAVQIELAPVSPFTAVPNSTIALETSICGLAPSRVLPSSVAFRSLTVGCPAEGISVIQFLANTTFPTIDLAGFFFTTSFLWRTPAEIPTITVTSTYSIYQTVVLLPPSGAKVISVFSEQNPNLEVSNSQISAKNAIIVTGLSASSPVVVIYQPSWWDALAVSVMAVAVCLVTILAYYRNRLPLRIIRLRKDQLARGMNLLRCNSSQILSLFLLVASLMISVSVIVGPDPRARVYALTVTDIPQIRSVVSDLGGITITPSDQTPVKLASLTQVDSVDIVVIGDFPYPGPQNDRLFTALSYAPRLVVVQNLTDTAFQSELLRRFPDKTSVISNIPALGNQLSEIQKRGNILGIVDPGVFVLATEFVGISSFVLVFFALAYLPVRLLESGHLPATTGLAEAISVSVLVFVLSEGVYTASSTLLGVPIGLHAGTLGSSATAIGFLGFGGGSRPRAIAGLLGFAFGGLASRKNRVRLSSPGIIIFFFVLLFLVTDPLSNGALFYQLFLFFATSGPTLQFAQNTILVFKAYLSTIGYAFGAFASPVYDISTGVILYYAFSIPFSLYSRVRPATGTFLFLVCAFAASDGFIRIAENDPWKIVSTIFPGVATGLMIAAIFALTSLAERHVETLLSKGFR